MAKENTVGSRMIRKGIFILLAVLLLFRTPPCGVKEEEQTRQSGSFFKKSLPFSLFLAGLLSICLLWDQTQGPDKIGSGLVWLSVPFCQAPCRWSASQVGRAGASRPWCTWVMLLDGGELWQNPAGFPCKGKTCLGSSPSTPTLAHPRCCSNPAEISGV